MLVIAVLLDVEVTDQPFAPGVGGPMAAMTVPAGL